MEPTTQASPAKRVRKAAWEAAGVPRHELPKIRVRDLEALLNLSKTSVFRLRRVPGFPKPDALARLDRQEVLAFVASMTPDNLHTARVALRERAIARCSTDAVGTGHTMAIHRAKRGTPSPAPSPQSSGHNEAPGSGRIAEAPPRERSRRKARP